MTLNGYGFDTEMVALRKEDGDYSLTREKF
jgi:hypothetical protein